MTDLPRSAVAAEDGNLFAGQPIVVRRIGEVAPASAPATSSLNKTLAILLVAILALAPLPLGSTRKQQPCQSASRASRGRPTSLLR